MEKILQCLEKIESAQGGNAKKELLTELLRQENGEEFIRIAFSKTIYGVGSRSFEKALEQYNASLDKYEDAGQMVFFSLTAFQKTPSFADVKQMLDEIKNSSGNVQIDNLTVCLNSMNALSGKWFTRTLLKNMRLGLTLTSVNAVLKSMKLKEIEKFEVQLCGKINDITEWDSFPVIAGVKYDGFRCIVEKQGDEIIMTSRQGKQVDFVPEIVEELKKLKHDFILDGEIMAKNFNAIQARIGRKQENIETVEGLHYRMFDILQLNGINVSINPQLIRIAVLKSFMHDTGLVMNKLFNTEEYIVAENSKTLVDFYDACCERKEEGIIIKKPDSKYEYGARSEWTKVKPVVENSFEVLGATEGRGKHVGKVGALIVGDLNSRVVAKVGSGIDDEMRAYLTKLLSTNELVGIIVDVKYFEVTNNKSGEHSLRFPRLIKVRSDKFKADEVLK